MADQDVRGLNAADLQALHDAINRPVNITIETLSDLMPEPFSGDDDTVDCEDFFKKYVSWLGLHRIKFPNDHSKVAAFKHVITGPCLSWWGTILQLPMYPGTVNEIQQVFFAKYRHVKSRSQYKAELNRLKYIPGESCLGMINKFVVIADKLEWPEAVQIDRLIKTLPIQLRQFVISRNYDTFTEVKESIKRFQELIEVESVTHTFRNVSFAEEETCGLCQSTQHKSLRCPSLKSLIEMEVSSKEPQAISEEIKEEKENHPRGYSPNRRSQTDRGSSQERRTRFDTRGGGSRPDNYRRGRYSRGNYNNNTNRQYDGRNRQGRERSRERQYDNNFRDRRNDNYSRERQSDNYSRDRQYSRGNYRQYGNRYQGQYRNNSSNRSYFREDRQRSPSRQRYRSPADNQRQRDNSPYRSNNSGSNYYDTENVHTNEPKPQKAGTPQSLSGVKSFITTEGVKFSVDSQDFQ